MLSNLETPELGETVVENPMEPKSVRGNQKLIIVTVVALVIATILIAVGVLWKNGPKEQWLLAEYKTFNKQEERFTSLLGSSVELQKAIQEKAFKNQIEISMSMNSAQDDFMSTIIKNILSNSKVLIDYQSDPKNSKNFIDLAYELRGNTFLDAQFYQSQEDTGVRVPLLFNSYYFIKNDQLGNIMRKFDSNYSGPERMRSVQDSLEMQTQLIELDKKTKKILVDQIPDTAVSSERNGLDRTITIHLSEEEVHSAIKNSIDAVRNDQEYMQLLVSFIENAGGAQVEEEIMNALEDLYQATESLQMPKGIKMDLIVENGLIVERRVNFALGEADMAVDFTISSSHTFNQADMSSHWVFESQSGTEYFAVLGEWETKSQSGLLKDTISIDLQMKSEDDTIVDHTVFDFENQVESKDKNIQELVSDFTLDFSESSFGISLGTIKGTLKQTVDQNLKKNYSNTDSLLDIQIMADGHANEEQLIDFELQIKSNVQFTDKLDFPDFTSDQAVDLSDMGVEEIENVFYEVEEKFTNFINQNFELGLFYY